MTIAPANIPDSLFFWLFLVFLVLVLMLGIWNNWIWIGKDGYNLPSELRPGFFRFWFYVAPRYLLGMRTGMNQ
jgi:hypothetical protein